MKNLEYKKILIFYLSLLPIVFIGRFTFEISAGNAHISVNYIYPLLTLTVLILFVKHRKNFLTQILRFISKNVVLLSIAIALITIDIISILASVDKHASFIAFIKRLAVYALFVFSSFAWQEIASSKHNLQRIFNQLYKTWDIIFLLNALISILQILDCYFFSCHNMIYVQQFFTSSALPPRSQMFGYWSPKNPVRIKLLRPPGIFGDTNYNGMFLLLSIVLFFIWYIYSRNNKERLYNALKIQFALAILLLTFSRSAVLGLIVYLPLLLILARRNIKKTAILALGTIISVVLAILGLYLISPQNLTFIARRLNIKKDPSSLTHEKLFNESLQIIKAHKPGLFGNGLDTYSTLYNSTIRSMKKKTNPHSLWIQTYIEQGIIGVIAVAGLGGFLLIRAYRQINNLANHKRDEAAIILTTIFYNLIIPYFMIVGLVYYGFYMPFVWAWGIIPLGKQTQK